MKKLLLLLAFCTSAHAEFMDGNALYTDMRGTATSKAIAIGYIMGVADQARGITFCPPENVTAGQLLDMVDLFLSRNPDKRHYTANSIVAIIIAETWPCKQQKRGTTL